LNYRNINKQIYNYIKIINKYYTNIDSKLITNKITIDGKEYIILKEYGYNEKSKFTKMYIKNYSLTFYLVEITENNMINDLIILNDDYKIKLVFKESVNILKKNNYNEEYNLSYQIEKVYFNDNEVIKFSDIYFPFKYTIPLNTPYFIYKEHNIYKIFYILNSFENSIHDNYSRFNLSELLGTKNDIEFKNDAFDKFISSLMLKDLLIYENYYDIYSKISYYGKKKRKS
jgi:hypothetical protein